MAAHQKRTALFKALTVVTMVAMGIAIAHSWQQRKLDLRTLQRATDLECLARNVYYESRGEPLAGQYAVAEVTMNRVASPDFPESVCGVVHARGAFSWTFVSNMPDPYGYEWRRARAVAETVYDNLEAPLVSGALFYHATRVSPIWAPTRSQVALIGRHLFYL